MYKKCILLLFILFAGRPAQAQFNTSSDAAQIRLEFKKLTVLGSVLYIAAHPDDENNAFLTYMSKGLCHRTAYLSCTRGEGGQNLLGPEQGSMLGLIRTQELLAARRIDGAEQYFTRAIDFGFSKSSEETLRFWGTEKTLSDVVWVIRTFRPDVIVTRFTPALGGHGNHTASASLAYTAFRAAADSTRFPEQLRFTAPWQAKRLVWNAFRFSARDTSPRPLHGRPGRLRPITRQVLYGNRRRKQEHAQEPGIRLIAIPRGIHKLFSTYRRRHSEKRSFRRHQYKLVEDQGRRDHTTDSRRSESNFRR